MTGDCRPEAVIHVLTIKGRFRLIAFTQTCRVEWLLEAIPVFRGSGSASNSYRYDKGKGQSEVS